MDHETKYSGIVTVKIVLDMFELSSKQNLRLFDNQGVM